jgi:DtxR family Mn-dependent transcriptional regulator
MTDPATALAVFFAAAAVLAAVLWPGRGVAAKVARLLRHTSRILAEDALKHVYHCEVAGRTASIESIAGALDVPQSRAVAVVRDLTARELLRQAGREFALSEAGRAYAVHVVRSHRLWERYLADRTGVGPEEWHEQAEVAEHDISRADADRLASRLGSPLFDPHGDPIPTAQGETPARRGAALSSLAPGESATIVHLEDEPRLVFDQLLAEGLAPGMTVRVRESSPDHVAFEAGGREHRLAPVVAANVTVRHEAAAQEPASAASLADVRPGEEATVAGLAAACQGPQRRRLLDLGFVPGTRVRAEMSSALGDPVAYRVRDAVIALRREQAGWVRIEEGGGGSGAGTGEGTGTDGAGATAARGRAA